MMNTIYKYPRTAHIAGSGLQRGDEDVPVQPFRELAGRHLVVEEKMDGANSAVSFHEEQLLLQSRGHYLTGGPREAQFHLFKTWANTYTADLYAVLGERYVMYGEWLYAKHTVFYTDLPHYFMEFDLYDKQTGEFLSTEQRGRLLAQLACVTSVKVLYKGKINFLQDLIAFIGPSHFISADHREQLREVCEKRHLDVAQVFKETDSVPLMEGLYIKVEEDGVVKERYKYVRASFLQSVADSENHWMERPIIPNRLKPGVSLFKR